MNKGLKFEFLNPEMIIKSYSENHSVKNGFKNFLVKAIVIFIVLVLISMFGVSNSDLIYPIEVFGIASLFSLPLTFIVVGVFWVVARRLNGNGSYVEHYYLTSLFSLITILAVILFELFIVIFSLVHSIPLIFQMIGAIEIILVTAFWLYCIYFVIKDVNKFSSRKTLATLLISSVVMILLLSASFFALQTVWIHLGL